MDRLRYTFLNSWDYQVKLFLSRKYYWVSSQENGSQEMYHEDTTKRTSVSHHCDQNRILFGRIEWLQAEFTNLE